LQRNNSQLNRVPSGDPGPTTVRQTKEQPELSLFLRCYPLLSYENAIIPNSHWPRILLRIRKFLAGDDTMRPFNCQFDNAKMAPIDRRALVEPFPRSSHDPPVFMVSWPGLQAVPE
jgi:hypothetical protein